ncbi:surface-anchored 5'-nucleotidase [Streptococcus iniae]|uniref:Bifunctional metallophosphatase/5'-nucleotidase n=2 Tax=Streptococcus iniae TaxID=1346 RepID=A0A3L8GHT1_STRIN|nr:5'-nucleotidase C-terminal domain-containing protein [Streptococcus iniae]AJG26046.1 5'-nucleotidase [Streptococcus iniae]ASL34866.1 surface-anchored 5'-nucleotidase [Streptococcus iniae]ATX39845.1 Endonuclease YhcR [Streptococcus iniae]AYB02891.1 bifunctional metallophosphatase/5'-nucleotidase [Streptococcus iniae]EKB52830.1 5'-nucleotidase [Streptococcus iniae 9117]
MKKHIVLKSSILTVMAGMSILVTSVQADQVDVQILGVNDFHGALDQTGSAYMPAPEGKVSGAGTAAQLDAYMDKANEDFKQASPDGTSIRVQAGDMVGASPANSGLLQDEPTVKVFNEMGVEYGTLGNHEFDEGLAEYNRIMTGKAPAADSTINEITKNYTHVPSSQTIVISNVIDKTTKEIPYNWKPYAIKNIPVNNTSVNIGFIGVVTTEIPNLVLRKNYEQYEFLDEAQTIVKYAKELKNQNVNAIVILAHIPAISTDGVVGSDVAAIMEKVNKLYPENSIDIIFAGHNHQYTNGTIGTTRVVQAVSQGKAYADVRGKLDTTTQDFVETPTAKVLAVAPKKLAGSPDIQAIVDEANKIVATVTTKQIGTAANSEMISKTANKDNESALGNLVTSAQLAVARETYPDVDFAMTNNGGIRSDLIVSKGNSITWGAAQAVQPFGNILQVVELTGQDIYDVLNEQYDEDQKYFLQMSGLKYTFTTSESGDPSKPFKVVRAFTDKGVAIDPKASYKVVVNDFLFGGGDGFATFRKGKLIGAINPDTEVFIKYIKDKEAKHETIAADFLGIKTFVTSTVESSKTSDDMGHHDIVKRVYRDRDGHIVDEEIISDLVTPNPQSPTKQTALASPQALAKTSTMAKKQELPHTGSKENQAGLLSMLGLVTLFFAKVSKKKEEN